MKDIKRLYPFIRPYRNGLILSVLLLSFAGILQSTTTTLTLPLFDKVLMPGQGLADAGPQEQGFIDKYVFFILSLIPGSIITQISLALLFLTVLKGVCLYYSNYSMSRIGQSVVMDLRNQLFHHVLGQSMSFFSVNSTGRLMSKMGSDVEQVQEAVSTVLAELVREVVLLATLIIVAFGVDWKLALLSLLIAPLALGLTLGMGKSIRHVSIRVVGAVSTACMHNLRFPPKKCLAMTDPPLES